MPSGQIHIQPPLDIPQHDPPQQVKLCASCLCPLNPVAESSDSAEVSRPTYLDEDSDTVICARCHERLAAARAAERAAQRQADMDRTALEVDRRSVITPTSPISVYNPTSPGPLTHHARLSDIIDEPLTIPASAIDGFTSLSHQAQQPPSYTLSPRLYSVGHDAPYQEYVRSSPAPGSLSPPRHATHSSQSVERSRSPITHRYLRPDPYVDITRIRVRSESRGCLYPGATFRGTQTSGRNSYKVDVTIVDVDFNSSFLCGYLRICGLTQEWPELQTYFDAEIIGPHYGFLTQDWGASEQEDMSHWSRFPAFRALKPELRRPRLTMKDRDRNVVFMRWKERFLVPDHRVKDITGASFAGFYYVCVEFNPQTQYSLPPPHHSSHLPTDLHSIHDHAHSSPRSPRQDSHHGQGRRSSFRNSNSSASEYGGYGPTGGVGGTAVMTGYYFHQHSEPHQQLFLQHEPDYAIPSFEFR